MDIKTNVRFLVFNDHSIEMKNVKQMNLEIFSVIILWIFQNLMSHFWSILTIRSVTGVSAHITLCHKSRDMSRIRRPLDLFLVPTFLNLSLCWILSR